MAFTLISAGTFVDQLNGIEREAPTLHRLLPRDIDVVLAVLSFLGGLLLNYYQIGRHGSLNSDFVVGKCLKTGGSVCESNPPSNVNTTYRTTDGSFTYIKQCKAV
jgi:hypothetical protein